MIPFKANPEHEDQLFRLLRQLDQGPQGSQRATAQAIGVSLGRFNALLRAATDAGFVSVGGNGDPDKRKRCAYSLTIRGGAEKNRLTDQFLTRKFEEFDALYAELT